MHPTLRIRLLGEFSLNYDGTPLATISTPRLQSLLTYLILHRAAPQARSHLAFCLWPDLPEARARANLRKQLHQLQRALPQADQFLSVDVNTIQWQTDGPFSLDVAEFEDTASHTHSRIDLQRAVELYGGELVPGCYDDWIASERERLKQVLIEVLERLLQMATDAHDYRAAIGSAQRLLQIDPVREEVHRRLMNLHTLNDDRATALRAYHTCVSTLQRELGVEPGPATREAYEHLLKIESSREVSLGATFPLVGRDREWAQLHSAWRSASAGQAQLAILIGEGGIGKTRLADELFTQVKRQGIHAAVAHCYSAEGTLAYAPVVTWLRARALPRLEPIWLIEIARLLPELLVQHPDLPSPGPLLEAWQRQRLHEALARAMLGTGGPVLLWIEDLQWCDHDTLEWLHYLLRFDEQARLLVMGTLRPEEALSDHPTAVLLAALRHDRRLIEIEVEPLDAAGTGQLAACVTGHDWHAVDVDCLQRETEGNPLFIVETLRAGSDCADTATPLATLPPTVHTVIAARLAQLSPQARALIELAAIIGREFTFDVLQQAGGGDEEMLVRGLDELWQRRVIREIGTNAYDFSHGKLRDVAYAGLSAARKRLLHRRVAEALAVVHTDGLDSVSAQVAVHYQQAGLLEQAVGYYRRAAEAARQVYAHQAAITYLSNAINLIAKTADVERYDLLLDREAIYDVLGLREAQQRDLIELQGLAQVLHDEVRQAEVYLREARYAESVSDYAAAIKVARAAIHLAEAAHDIHREAAGYLQWGRALWQHGEMEGAGAQLVQALKLSQAARLPDVEADSLYNLSCVAELQGDQISACDYASQAVGLYRLLANRRGEFRALNTLGIAQLRPGDAAQAYLCFDQALQICREIGDRRGESMVLRNLGGCAADSSGGYAAARAYFEQSWQICRQIGERRGESESLTYLGLTARQMGDPQSACDYCQRAVQIAQQVGAKYEEGVALTQLGYAWLSLGQLSQAAEVFREALAIRRQLGNLSLVIEPLAGLASISLDQGDLPQAQTLVEEILNHLTSHTLDEVDEPLLIYLICYRVLQAGHDPRASELLKPAYKLLQARAAQLPDDVARQSFLDNNAVERAIVQAWNSQA